LKRIVKKQVAESFVFDRTLTQGMYRSSVVEGTVRLRSHSDAAEPSLEEYEDGVDYRVDYASGTIGRTENGKIPDWSSHPLFGVNDFDHTIVEYYSNDHFTVYADYDYYADDQESVSDERMPIEQSSNALAGIARKLAEGKEITYVVYGDSISTGCDASSPILAYFNRLADHLSDKYPPGRFRILNESIGGETSEGGAERLFRDVLPHSPDLVTIGYGMNDQNKFEHGNSVSIGNYEKNIRYMVEAILRNSNSAIVLITPCQPNPKWKHASGRIGEYAAVLRKLSKEYGVGLADAGMEWQRALEAGKTHQSLLLNNINHPGDFGHWLYFKAFESMLAT
jgi:lysophospholipase L1-like esterase